MKIIVDSNIVFSAILNTKSKIGQLIINSSSFFDFYSVQLLKAEIIEHKSKILRITGFSDNQFAEIFQLVTCKIKFVDDILLSDKDLNKALNLVAGIDTDDAMFVALTNRMLATLWTGDKQLIKGLKKKGYSRIISTEDLYALLTDKQHKAMRKRK